MSLRNNDKPNDKQNNKLNNESNDDHNGKTNVVPVFYDRVKLVLDPYYVIIKVFF